MRNRFTRALYAAAAIGVASAGITLSVGTASAATHDTNSCGDQCMSLFSQQLGSSVTQNAYVPGDLGTGGKIGQKVNLHLDGNFRPNGDFVPDISGFVFQFCGFLANDYFSPTSYVCLHYPFFSVFEVTWSPFGNNTSNLCVGAKSPTFSGENVTLQSCGTSPNTLWIADRANSTHGLDCRDPVDNPNGVPGSNGTLPVPAGDPTINFCPWINGSDPNTSQPLVLTLNTGTHNPTNQLFLAREQLFGGVAKSTQQFAFYFGPAS